MNPLYLLLLPILGISAYFVYQKQQQAQSAQNSVLEKELIAQSLQTDIAVRDASIADLKRKQAATDALVLDLREQLALATEEKETLQVRTTHLENETTGLEQQIESHLSEITYSKALFATLTHAAYDIIFVLDSEWNIIACSDAAAAFVNNTMPIGQKLNEIIDAPDLYNIIEHAIGEEEGLEEQFTLDKRYFRARVQRYKQGNQCFIGVALQDVSQLVRLNRARRDMVANISHELGTPVANIRVIIDSLFHDQSRPKRKASINSLRAIARETEALQDTVQELLDLSMIESGQAIVKLVDEPLLEIVDSAIERVGEKFHRKNLQVVRHVPARINVVCDRDHIRRVITNLLSNAVKWSPKDGAITISATVDGEDIKVSVFDNGPGVPDDQRERIFERFYQVDTARSGREGSGLGLAISKHIIEAHGGKIWAEGNSRGGGGRFLFTLLSATPSTDDAVMDKGQHDAILNPYKSPQYEDEGEIEFVEDDELDE